MAVDTALVEWVREALEPIGTVTFRRMMGAGVLYCDGTIFAVVDEEAIYFKADDVSAHLWDAEGCPPFTFEARSGETVATRYRSAPADVYDDADAMREWAEVAIAAGLRAATAKKPKRSKARQV
jgi:DNA transformation protein